jgi:hypothetical protein
VRDNEGDGGAPPTGPAAPLPSGAGRPAQAAPVNGAHRPIGPAGPADAESSTGNRDRRWSRRAEVATVIGTLVGIAGLVVALLAWLDPTTPPAPGSAASPSAPAARAPTGSPAPGSAPPGGGGTTSAGTEVRYLAALSPATGGAYVQTGGTGGQYGMVIHCGTGESDDQYREVAWDLVGGYARFTATATASGQADAKARVGVQVFTDDVQAANPLLTLGQSASLDVQIAGVHRIALRVTCELPSMAVTFADATLAG